MIRVSLLQVEDLEQRRRPDLIYEGFPQVKEERDSLKDQLSGANRKKAELENMARAFQAQESFNHKLSNGKKEEDDGKDTEIERLEGELGIKNSLTGQRSVGEKVIKRCEYRIEAKDEKIRQLEDELAMRAEENQRLKSQLDRKGKEFAKLRNNIRSAYTEMEKAVATLGSAFMFTVKSPPENGNDYSYDLLGAMPSAGDDMWLKYLSDGDDK
ncbi:hypothetical protein OIU74_023416 [Salix koriyanagi]|uniref:Uncharacterized protein n=1 Tax=Salix koriyanagi TaxID=2511006 RepID=A0A9Q0WDN4_9ROSI|nr:hypothetical protein OIU74_023416 [Salix koriyanagi]